MQKSAGIAWIAFKISPFLFLLASILFLAGCTVTVAGQEYKKSQVSYLKVAKFSRVVSIDETTYKYKPSKGYWLLPGDHKIGAVYDSTFLDHGPGGPRRRGGRGGRPPLTRIDDQEVQYKTHTFAAGVKYLLTVLANGTMTISVVKEQLQ